MPDRILGRAPGIRVRTTFIAVVVVGISVSLAMLALVFTARSSLTGQITMNAEARAQDIALLAKAGSVPNPVPGRGEDLLVQVVDHSGKVLASSASIEGQAPLTRVTLAPGTSSTARVASVSESGGGETAGEGGADSGVAFLVAAVGVGSPSGPVTVVVVASLNPVQQVVDILTPRLALGLPVILVVVGLTVWLLTGRALHPVEAIRAQAEAISATSLERRVPIPGTQDEIGRLAETMNRMLDRLESSALTQRRFVSDASHELKSPVASIRTIIDVARITPPDDLESFLDDLAAEDVRMEVLVRDLLVLARIDERASAGEMHDVDIDDVILQEVALVEKASGVAIDTSGVHPVRLRADAGQVCSVVRNLLENGTRHASSSVWLSLRSESGEAVLTVSDDGPGIPAYDRERVFERFVRLDESRSRHDGGTGLGLAVCRAISRSMGGDVRVVEPLHGGATFEVRLPLPPHI